MQLNTVMPYKHVGQRYAFTQVQDPVTLNIIREYYPAGTFRLTFITSDRRTPRIYTDVDLELFDQINNINDPAGNSIDDEVWFVSGKLPALDAFGYLTAHSYSLSRYKESNG